MATDEDGFPVTHLVSLVVHEAGHPVFHAFGYTMGILGGTLAEILVPLLIAVYFFRQRHAAGVAFCLFWMFHTFSGISVYMADARTVSLPLIGSGDHDWEILFTQWGVLHLDTRIAAVVRALGWLGMLSIIAWFAWMYRRIPPESHSAPPGI